VNAGTLSSVVPCCNDTTVFPSYHRSLTGTTLNCRQTSDYLLRFWYSAYNKQSLCILYMAAAVCFRANVRGMARVHFEILLTVQNMYELSAMQSTGWWNVSSSHDHIQKCKKCYNKMEVYFNVSRTRDRVWIRIRFRQCTFATVLRIRCLSTSETPDMQHCGKCTSQYWCKHSCTDACRLWFRSCFHSL